MEIVERILAIIVGQEISPEELVEVTGGKMAPNCLPGSIYVPGHGCKEF